MARWNPSTGLYGLYSYGESGTNSSDAFATFLPPDATGANPTVSLPPAGLGYWVMVPQATALHVEGTDIPLNQYAVQLTAGWNQVANPFPFSIDWNAAQVQVNGQSLTVSAAGIAGWVLPTAFTYNSLTNGYTSLTAPATSALTLASFQGFWVYAYQSATLIFPPNPLVSASGAP